MRVLFCFLAISMASSALSNGETGVLSRADLLNFISHNRALTSKVLCGTQVSQAQTDLEEGYEVEFQGKGDVIKVIDPTMCQQTKNALLDEFIQVCIKDYMHK